MLICHEVIGIYEWIQLADKTDVWWKLSNICWIYKKWWILKGVASIEGVKVSLCACLAELLLTMNELFFSIIICVVTVVLLAVHQSYSTTGPVWHWCPSWKHFTEGPQQGKDCKGWEIKSCQLQARGPPLVMSHPLWDTYEGWDGASV